MKIVQIKETSKFFLDILYNELSVEEHLELIAKVRDNKYVEYS